MHDKNNRRLYVGDQVLTKINNVDVRVVTINKLYPDVKTCNILATWPIYGTFVEQTFTSKETELIVTRDGEVAAVRTPDPV